MRYAVLGGGKRIRPLLACATAAELRAPLSRALMPACALEYLHAYSLIHDDLPCMDDDDMRRGRASCHRAYDEATAVLAGDALQALAFECVARAPDLGADTRLAMVEALSLAAGYDGMVGGQARDIEAANGEPDLDDLKSMHAAKTGALICLSVRFGTLIAGHANAADLIAFGEHIGLAFQVVDDVLDVTGSTESLGKVAGADAAMGKVTFPDLLGLEGARATARSLHEAAVADLVRAGVQGGPLVEIAGWVVEREF